MKHTQSSTTPVLERQSQLPQRLPSWRLWVPLLLQTGLILASPAQSFYTQVTGRTVILQTALVDPYDPLRGYSQTLSYDISRIENLRSLPGGKELFKSSQQNTYLPSGTEFYVILAAPASTKSQPPLPWKPVSIRSNRPSSLPANQIALKGKSTGNSIEYGLETYYMPASRANEINQEINQTQRGRQPQSFVVEVKVDNQGHAVPISLWVSKRNYRF